jgi:hypothetical protein
LPWTEEPKKRKKGKEIRGHKESGSIGDLRKNGKIILTFILQEL